MFEVTPMFEVIQIWIQMQRAMLRRFPIMPLVVLGALATGAAPARATGGPEIEGRWEGDSIRDGDGREAVVLDVSRCGEKYCGRLVTARGRCLWPVLSVVPTAKTSSRASEPTFDGQMNGTKVRVTITAGKMLIVGRADPSWRRRTFPYSASLARIGDAHCGPSPTS
jgi:hypothetical protein